jgi:GDP-mannose 6-dehydrogenase
MTIFGGEKERTRQLLSQLYADQRAPLLVLPPAEALMVKYASNVFHALKVTFANEMGAICRASGLDAESVMAAFRKDSVLNISPRYLKPGFAFGGSCLPKDLRAVLYAARQLDVELPLLRAILESNAVVIERAVRTILDTHVRHVGMVGLSFKSDTDDLRESPFVEVAERLLGKGVELAIYDPNVLLARLTGNNKAYIDSTLPYLSCLLVPTIDELVRKSHLLVIGHRFAELEKVPSLLTHDCMLLDLTDLRTTTVLQPREIPCYPPAVALHTAF